MRKIVLTYGLISGAILGVMMLLTFVVLKDRVDFDQLAVIGYTTMVLAFLMVFFGVKSYRDNVAGGSVTFGRAFKVGLLIMLVGSACYVATWQVVYHKLAPDFLDRYAAHSIQKASASGATEVQIAAQTKKMEDFKASYRNPFVNIAWTFLEPMPVGLVLSLVTAGVLSRKRRVEGAVAA